MRKAGTFLLVCAGILCLLHETVDAQVPPAPRGAEQPMLASLDWRNVGGHNYVSGVRDQGQCGSDWAFVTVSMLESALMIRLGLPDVDLDYSEQRLLSCGIPYSGCNGGQPSGALNYLRDTGTPRETCFPYQANDQVPCSAACADAANQIRRLQSWRWVGGYTGAPIDSLKAALAYGPIGVWMDVYDDFYHYAGGVYWHVPGGSPVGSHYVLVIGYDDAQQYWIVKNSWDTWWGDQGFFRIAYVNNCRFGDWATACTAAIPPINWCNLQWPPALNATAGVASDLVFGQLWIDVVTSHPGATPELVAELGYGPDGSDPSADPAGWQWTPAAYNLDVGANDEFMARVTVATPGEYDYCYRYSYFGGPWRYADLDGTNNGYSPAQAGALTVTSASAAEDGLPAQLSFALQGGNPFVGSARFRLGLPQRTRVELSIHDVTGRRLATLASGELDAGYHTLTWEGEGTVQAGAYFARLHADGRSFTRKLTVLR